MERYHSEVSGKLSMLDHVQSMIYLVKDTERFVCTGILVSNFGSSQPVISRKIAESVDVKLYPSTRDPTPGAPPTAKVYHVALEIVGLKRRIPYCYFYSSRLLTCFNPSKTFYQILQYDLLIYRYHVHSKTSYRMEWNTAYKWRAWWTNRRC